MARKRPTDIERRVAVLGYMQLSPRPSKTQYARKLGISVSAFTHWYGKFENELNQLTPIGEPEPSGESEAVRLRGLVEQLQVEVAALRAERADLKKAIRVFVNDEHDAGTLR